MSKWKHPYVIKVVLTTTGAYYHLMALMNGRINPPTDPNPIVAKHYCSIDSFDTLEQAMIAKHKAYARLEK